MSGDVVMVRWSGADLVYIARRLSISPSSNESANLNETHLGRRHPRSQLRFSKPEARSCRL